MTSAEGTWNMYQAPGGRITCADCALVLEWLKRQAVAAAAAEFTLPGTLAHLSATGRASGLRTPDGRYCVLLKTSIGWKDNFEGIFCSDRPLPASEIVGNDTERAYISIGDEPLFQELYIRKRYSETCVAVYFDLH